MAKITLKKKGGIVAEYDLTKLPAKITIGSDPFDIIYIYDEKIFKKHLLLEQAENRYIIENLRGSQDALINGRNFDQKVELNNGDQVSLGDFSLIFSDIEKAGGAKTEDRFSFPENQLEPNLETEPAAVIDESFGIGGEELPIPGEETVLRYDVDLATPEQPGEMAATRISEVIPPAYDLLVIRGPYTGNKYRLKPDSTRIGRDQNNNDIVIRENKKGEIDYTISRRHATITVKNGRYYLSDNNSKNGTYFNKERLGENDERLLKDGDEIELVSEEQSTIFRFVPADRPDFSPPRSGAKGQIRPGRIVAAGLAIICIAIGLVLFKTSHTQRSIILEKPGALIIKHTQLNANEVFAHSPAQFPKFSDLNYRIPTPALVNIEKNGAVALILLDPDGLLVAWDFNKNQLVWKINSDDQAAFDYSITVSDLNDNGISEILLSGRDSRVYAYDCKSGNQFWKSDLLGRKLSSQPSVGDLNGDGFKDVVVCSEEGELHVGIASGQAMTWKSLPYGYNTKAIPVVADIDSDGSDEILIGTEDGIVPIFVLKDQQIIAKQSYDIKLASPTYYNNSINNAMAYGRLPTAPREPALIITTRQYGVISVDPINFDCLWHDKLTDPYQQLPLYHSSPLLGDINSDGSLDAVVASHNGDIIMYSNVGNSSPGKPDRRWAVSSKPGTAFFATPALADLNKDGKLDIVAADTMGTLYLINGLDGNNLYEPIESKGSFSASPLVGDVNGDSYLDIVAVDNCYNIHLFESKTRIARNTITWGQYTGAAGHSCLFLYPAVKMLKYNLKLYLSVMIILAALGYIVLRRAWRVKRRT